MKSWNQWLRDHLDDLESRNQLRRLRVFSQTNRRLQSFAHNDYLGMAQHPGVQKALRESAADFGMGQRSAALLTGYGLPHRSLETSLAQLKNQEEALLFPTGWAANTGMLTALAGGDLTLFSDQLNHASIIDGCRLAKHLGATVKIYRHGDPDHLESLLRECTTPRKLIVSDSLFGMDGTLAPLNDLVRLKEEYGAWLALDEAHATLVLGSTGSGAAEAAGVEDSVDISVGTLSKAFGCQGGFIASSATLKQFLLNRARPFIFSTSLPVPVVVAAQAALQLAADGDLRNRLSRHIMRLNEALSETRSTPIFPIILGSERDALEASERLRGEGFVVPAIRPPTVPAGTSRLRVSLSAAHSSDDLERFIQVLTRKVLPGQD